MDNLYGAFVLLGNLTAKISFFENRNLDMLLFNKDALDKLKLTVKTFTYYIVSIKILTAKLLSTSIIIRNVT